MNKLPPDVRALLARADEEQAAFEEMHLTATPSPEPKQKVFALSEVEINEIVMRKIDMLASVIGAECGEMEKRILEKMMAEVGQLRAEITVSSTGDKGVVDFGKWRNDDAA